MGALAGQGRELHNQSRQCAVHWPVWHTRPESNQLPDIGALNKTADVRLDQPPLTLQAITDRQGRAWWCAVRAAAPSATSSLPTCRQVTASIARNCTLQHCRTDCCCLLRSHAIRLHFLHEILSRSEVSCQFFSTENDLTLNIGVTGQGFETFHSLNL